MTALARPARLLVGLVVALVATLAPVGAATASAQNRAGVVVDTGDGTTRKVCIRFDAASISGEEALRLAAAQDPSLSPVFADYGGMGKAVCSLCGIGGDGGDCFADPTRFWAYHQAAPGTSAFRQSLVGVSRTTVTDGSVEGYRYGSGAAPAFADIRTICGEVLAAPPAAPTTAAPPPTTAPPTTAPPPTEAPPTEAPATTTAAPTTAPRAAAPSTPTTTTTTTGAGEPTTTTTSTSTTSASTTSTTAAPAEGDDLVAVRATDDGAGGGSPLALAGVGAVGIGLVAVAVALRRARSR